MLRSLPVVAQGVGVLAVLVGLFLLLPVGAAVLTGGALLTVVGIAVEVAQGRPSAPSDRRSGPSGTGAV